MFQYRIRCYPECNRSSDWFSMTIVGDNTYWSVFPDSSLRSLESSCWRWDTHSDLIADASIMTRVHDKVKYNCPTCPCDLTVCYRSFSNDILKVV